MKKHHGRTVVAGLLLACTGLLAGCTNTESPTAPMEGSGASNSAGAGLGVGGRDAAEQVAKVSSVAALVPAEIAKAGKMTVVTDPTYAPMDFTDERGNIIGLEPDFAIAAAKKMGLEVEFAKADFNGILAGLQSKRYDASWAAWSITADRVAAVDMVGYFNAGSAVMVKAGDANKIASIDDLCGKTVAAQTGTTQALKVLPDFEANCQQKSLPNIDELIVPQQDSANEAVASGRADAMVADNSLVAYYAQVQPSAYASVPGILVEPALIGVAMPKGNDSLAPAFQAAIQSLIDDGTYETILNAWGLGDSAITTVSINQEK